MHTTLKNVELLKHFKIRKTAPSCLGLQGNHHQGATANTQNYTLGSKWIRTARTRRQFYGYILLPVRRTVYPHTVHSTHASQVTICSHNTDNVLYELYVSTLSQVCNFG